MDISPLFDLRQRLHTAALAGAASCPGDARLAQASEGLAPLEAAAPVFRKLGDLVRTLRAPEGDERAAVLLEALTLADALACTQAVVAVPGEAGPVEPAVAWGGAVEDVPFSVLREVRESLLCPEDWQNFSFMKRLADTRREWFRDARLRGLLLRLLDTHENGDVHRQVARWLVEQGRDILPLLRAGFDPKGKEGMAIRVRIIREIAGDEANDFYVSHLSAANKDIRCELLKALPATEENAGSLLRLYRSETEAECRAIICAQLARTPLPSRWEHLRTLKEIDPKGVLKALAGIDAPEASALTVELWEHILPSYEAGPLDRSGYDFFKDTLLGKSGPGIHDIYRRVAALDKRVEDKKAKAEVRFICHEGLTIGKTADALKTSILATRDEGLLELAGELAHDVSPRFAVPWLTGLLVMRSTGAAYDAARELLGPDDFGHGTLSATAQRILADVFFKADSLVLDSSRDAMIHPFDEDELDADCFAVAATTHACVFRLYSPPRQYPFADALDPRWLDVMMSADPFEAYPYYASRTHKDWATLNEQRTLADLLFRLADLQDPHTRERLGAFFHEQALRGVERGIGCCSGCAAAAGRTTGASWRPNCAGRENGTAKPFPLKTTTRSSSCSMNPRPLPKKGRTACGASGMGRSVRLPRLWSASWKNALPRPDGKPPGSLGRRHSLKSILSFSKAKCESAAQRRPAQSERKNRAFSAKRQAVWFGMRSISN